MRLALALMTEPPMGEGLTLATHLPCRNRLCYAGRLEGTEILIGSYVQYRGEKCDDCIGLDVLDMGHHRDRVAALWVCEVGECEGCVNDTEDKRPNLQALVDTGCTVCEDCAKL